MRNGSARFDIEALRAFAVSVVLLFHGGISWFGFGYVGVDVFFVVSGYLIIGLLHREYQRTGTIHLAEFWARRARRLLPAAALVIAVTAILIWIRSGRLEVADISIDLVAAAFYAANWRFGFTASDYWSPSYVSPALHFWSLGVEEQFYIFTPLAIVIAGVLFKNSPKRGRLAIPSLLAITVLAFWYATWLEVDSPIWAYYSPFARAWEFALGGIAALAATKFASPNWLRTLLWLLPVISAVNGIGAVWLPVLATALLLWLGKSTRTVEQTSKVLRPISWLGGISYSAYLWHWPLLWFASETHGSPTPEDLPARIALPVLLLSLLLAQLTKVWLEDPVRFRPELMSSARRSLLTGWAATAVASSVCLLVNFLPPVWKTPAPGMEILQPAVDTSSDWLSSSIRKSVPATDINTTLKQALPPLSDLRADKTSLDANHCHIYMYKPEPSKRCRFGSRSANRDIMLFGDSHAASVFAGLDIAASQLGYGLLTRTRDQCTAADVRVWQSKANRPYTECDEFRESVIQEAISKRPALVVILTLRPFSLLNNSNEIVQDQATGDELFRAGLRRTIQRLTSADIRVLVVHDLPYWKFDIPDCLATYGPRGCAADPQQVVPSNSLDIDIANSIPGANGVDFTNAICAPNICFPIRAGAIVVRDDVHLTETFAAKLAPLWQVVLNRFAAN